MDPRLTDMKNRTQKILTRIDQYHHNYKKLLETIEAVEAGLLSEDAAFEEIGRLISLLEEKDSTEKGPAWN